MLLLNNVEQIGALDVSDDLRWLPWHTWGDTTTWVDGRLIKRDGTVVADLDIGCRGDKCCVPAEMAQDAEIVWAAGRVLAAVPYERSPLSLIVPFDVVTTELLLEALLRFQP